MSDADTIREALLTLYQRSAENDTVVYFGAVRALQRLVAGSAPDPRDAVVAEAQRFLDLDYGYLGPVTQAALEPLIAALAALGSPVEPTAQQEEA